MSFCTNCGAQIPDGTKFCPECGQKMAATEPAPIQPEATPVQSGFTAPVQSEPATIPQNYDAPQQADMPPVQPQEQAADMEAAPLNPQPDPTADAPYTAPQQPASQSAQPGGGYYYTAPPQSSAPPVPPAGGVAYTAPGQTAVQAKKKSGGGKIILFVVLGVVVVAALAALLIWLLLGRAGKDDPNLGRYNCVSCDVFGTEMGADGEWVELKAHGKATVYLLEEEYSANWKLDGETFTLDESGLTYEGTLKDGVLTIDFFGMVYTFEKEGTSTTASGTSTSEPQEIGYWTLLRVDSDSADESMSEEDVALIKDLGIEFYADLKADGTGVLVFDDPVNFTWANGQITCETGEKCSYSLTDDLLHMDVEGADYVFTRGEGSAPDIGVAASTEPSEPDTTGNANLVEDDWWSGKWYGWLVVSNGSDYYAEDVDSCLDCIMDLDVYDDGNGYLELSTIEGESFGWADVSFGAGTTENGCMMSQNGYIFDSALDYADWIVDPGASMVSSFDHMISINGTVYDEDGEWYDYYIFLRPWGYLWEDVRGADTSDMLYDDMMPLYYDDWYLSQVEEGAPVYGD